MASAAPKVASLDRARFEKLMLAKAEAESRLARVAADLDHFRKAYSTAHRFKMVISVEQCGRDLAYRAEMEGGVG